MIDSFDDDQFQRVSAGTERLRREFAATSAAVTQANAAMSRSLRDFASQQRETAATSRQFGSAVTNAFRSAALQGKELGETMRTLALRLADIALNTALAPVEDAVSGIVSNLAGGIFGSAKGNLFSGGRPVPFARGGVVNSPVLFPLRGGRTGLMGEAGPEAVLPLRRGPNGELGVAGGGGRSLNVTVNISTPDAESFRRSEAQVAATIARASQRGARNL